jgi:hypothetical protein
MDFKDKYDLKNYKRIYESDLTDKKGEDKPALSDTTIKSYTRAFDMMKDAMNGDGAEWVQDIDSVLEKLNSMNIGLSRKRTILSGILTIITNIKLYPEMELKYKKAIQELNKSDKEFADTNQATEKQKENYVTYKDIEKMINDMKIELKGKENKELHQQYLLFSLYRDIKRRNEFGTLIYITKTDFDKLTNETIEQNNYLVMFPTAARLIINQYKTKKIYSQVNIPVKVGLKNKLNKYIKKYQIQSGESIFSDSRGAPLSSNTLTKLLQRGSQKYLKKNISTSMLFKIYCSDNFNDTKEKIAKVAVARGTSSGVVLGSYTKNFTG